jgi:tRNA(fMet)-specific endonuclease VapC
LILADTDVLIDYLMETQPVARQILAYRESDNLETSAVTCYELLSGAREGKRGDAVRRLLAATPIISLDANAATRAAAVRQQLEQEGYSIAMADSLIAGIALANDLPLMTRNRKHFEAVKDLRLISVAGI